MRIASQVRRWTGVKPAGAGLRSWFCTSARLRCRRTDGWQPSRVC